MVDATGPTGHSLGSSPSDLQERISVAVAMRWAHPDVAQRALRNVTAAHSFKVGVTWPTESGQGNSGLFSIGDHQRLARELENAGADFLLMTDGWSNAAVAQTDSGFRSILWAVPVILATNLIGVVTSMRTNYLAPMHIARFGSHLDWLSRGRWGWCVTPGQGVDAARLYGEDEERSVAERYAKAAEVVDAVDAIWTARERGVDFEGAYVRVHGLSKRPFTTQLPRPPLFGIGGSEPALALAASRLDVCIISQVNRDSVAAARQALSRQAAIAGRAAPRLYLKALIGGSGRTGSQPSATSLGATVEQAARRVSALKDEKLIDGLLIDLPGHGSAAIEELASFVALLTDEGLLEDLATRARGW